MDVLAYLGQPWHRREFNCWGLVRQVYARELGVDLPPVAVDPLDRPAVRAAFAGHGCHRLFAPVPAPRSLCLVALGRGDGPEADHVGLWLDLDGGRVLHNDAPTGVVCQRLLDMRRAGWRVRGYYVLKDSLPDEYRLPAKRPGDQQRPDSAR